MTAGMPCGGTRLKRISVGSRVIRLEDGLRQTIAWYQNNAEWLSKVRGGEYRSYYERYYGNRDSSLLEIARSKPRPP